MRIISGSAKGQKILAPPQGTRPSTDRAREALFNILSPLLEGANVLDLYAGSGALSLEALSRGASHATCVDSSRAACSVIRQNSQKTGLLSLRIVLKPVEAFLKTSPSPYDLIFADPPYEVPFEGSMLGELLKNVALRNRAHQKTFLVVESPQKLEKESYGDWSVVQRRRYGVSHFSFLQIQQSPEED